jgi:hypothetical protein
LDEAVPTDISEASVTRKDVGIIGAVLAAPTCMARAPLALHLDGYPDVVDDPLIGGTTATPIKHPLRDSARFWLKAVSRSRRSRRWRGLALSSIT